MVSISSASLDLVSKKKTVIGIVMCGSAWDALLVGCSVGGRVRCAS